MDKWTIHTNLELPPCSWMPLPTGHVAVYILAQDDLNKLACSNTLFAFTWFQWRSMVRMRQEVKGRRDQMKECPCCASYCLLIVSSQSTCVQHLESTGSLPKNGRGGETWSSILEFWPKMHFVSHMTTIGNQILISSSFSPSRWTDNSKA